MQNKKTIWLVVGFVVVALIFFYTGDKYASGKTSAQSTQNSSSFAARAGGAQRARGGGGVFGQIVAVDANSITVELSAPGGPNTNGTASTGTGSKIVFYTGQTAISKMATGTSSDLVVGTEVTVQGTANPDGSVSAQTISIRPAPNAPKS